MKHSEFHTSVERVKRKLGIAIMLMYIKRIRLRELTESTFEIIKIAENFHSDIQKVPGEFSIMVNN